MATIANGSKEKVVGEEGLEFLGDEWSTKQDFFQVIDEFIKPYVKLDDAACEIGCGGGRVAAKVSRSNVTHKGLTLNNNVSPTGAATV